jgi:poly(3-hydroxyalkanoate) synthetase
VAQARHRNSRTGSSTLRTFQARSTCIVRHLFRDNELISGSLEVGGERVDLRQLEMPLHLLAGATDHITPPDQVFAIADLASTPAELVTRDVSPGAHLGLHPE